MPNPGFSGLMPPFPGERSTPGVSSSGASSAVTLLPAKGRELPLFLSSPHSGAEYPAAFVRGSRLDPMMLRRSEDAFVDEIYEAAPALGAALLKAHFPRAYCDPNREAYELDPGMFADALPHYVNSGSRRAALGLGTIARIVASGADIHRGPIPFAEAARRVETCWLPYHRVLSSELERLRTAHGFAMLIDCHSMPSVGGPTDRDAGAIRPDVVLGDRFGQSCAPELTSLAEETLRAAGLRVGRNMPFAGGFITEHYGQPTGGVHALQIEINRALYMDEERIERRPGLQHLKQIMTQLVSRVGGFDLRVPVAAQ